MAERKRYSGAARVRKAYLTAFRVMLSYGWLLLRKRILGQAYYDKRIMALHVRNAIRVKEAILALKGLFIKVGQMLSILSNFLPEAFQKPLEELQDHVPPRPMAEVNDRFRREFGKLPGEVFARFDETPLAAASIGQAHRAQLADGTEVVVKVQHADIEEVAKIDLQIIKRLTRIISWFYTIHGMDHLYTQVRKMIEEELDFQREAVAMKIIGENLRDETGVKVPAVHPEYSSRILTTTWSAGVKISALDQIDAWGIDRSELASRLLHACCKMVFVDGYYHADPHPGNMLVEQDGALVLLDFGATGQAQQRHARRHPQLIEAAVKNDTQAMVDACRQMGFIADGRDAQIMAEKMINAMRNFLQNEVQFEGLNFKDIKVNPLENSLIELLRDIGISGISGTVQLPKEYVLLNRMLTLLLGLCNTLAPQLNPLDVVRPYAQEFVLGGKGDTVAFLKNFLKSTLSNLLTLPDEVRTVMQKARSGQLETLNPDVRYGSSSVYLAVQQVLFALLTAGLAWFAWTEAAHAAIHERYVWAVAGLCFLLFLKALRKGGKMLRS